MCILCGCADCTGEGALGAGGTAGANSDYVLINSGPDSSIPNSNVKWGQDVFGTPSDEITWSLSLVGLNMSGFAMSEFVNAAEAVFDAWASVANLTFTFVQGNADIDVVTANAAQVPGLAGTTVGLASYIFTPGQTANNSIAEITSSTIYMDLANAWSPNGEGGILSYFGVLLHEVGHALGLDHVDDEGQIMHTPISTNALGDGDIAGVRFLYGVREFFGSNGANNVTLSGDQGGGAYFALGGNDSVSGSSLPDLIFGGSGNDSLSGLGGSDFLADTRGNNTINGGGGDDTILGGFGTLDANGAADNDIIIGGIGADTLDGGAGNDVIRGDPSRYFGGGDTLTAGSGNDLLEGGLGADVFVFVPNGGSNTIARINNIGGTPSAGARDYEAGVDAIDLMAFSGITAGNVDDHWSDTVDGAFFNYQNTQITVVDTLVDELDFIP